MLIYKRDDAKINKEEDISKNIVNNKNNCCFSNKIFCFFAIIFVLTFGIIIGKYLTEKRSQPMTFKSDSVAIYNEKTWIAYNEPIVNYTILNDSNCTTCDSSLIEDKIKSQIATAIGNYIDISSPEADVLLKKINAKSVPVLIFDSNLEKISNFTKLSSVFDKNNDLYILNLAKIGISPGKFFEAPPVSPDDPQKGPKDAPITIIEYSDFECQFCKKGFDTMKEVVDVYNKKIKLVYKQFPLSFHQNARNAANASLCAKEEGKFWEMHDLLFMNQDKLTINDLKKYAKQIKLDMAKFNVCLSSNKYNSIIDNNIAEGTNFGISGTPAFFVNNVFISGAQSFDEFKKRIDNELSIFNK